MFKTILKYLNIIEKDVEEILADFDKTVVRLEKRAKSLYLEFTEHEAEAARQTALGAQKSEAANRASSAAFKIRDLVS